MSPLDLDALLRPIPGGAPSGEDLRHDPIHDEVRELRREEDALAPRGVWRRKLKAADWPAVIALTREALAQRSKDLQLAAWLAEALAARHGLKGAAAGLALLSGLVRGFWPILWPPPAEETGEEADEDARFAILEWLDARLTERLMLQPLTSLGEPPPTWHEHASLQRRRAGAHGRLAPEDEERAAAVDKAIARTPDQPLALALEEVAQLHRAIETLIEALRGAGLATPPSFPRLGTALDEMRAFLHSALIARGVSLEAAAPVPEAEAEPGIADRAEPEPKALPPAPEPVAALPPECPEAPPRWGPIASRDTAYRQLAEVAAYLEAQEPHSPVPALLRRAIRWGGMALPELLTELVHEEGGPFRLLRIAPTETAGE